MKKRSKRFREVLKNTLKDKKIGAKEALDLVKKNSTTKFDESIDVSLKINLKQSKGGDLNLRTNHCETYIDNLRKRKGYKIYSGFEYLQTKRHLVGKFNKLYVEEGYGGHLNKLGNVIISEWILDKL